MRQWFKSGCTWYLRYGITACRTGEGWVVGGSYRKFGPDQAQVGTPHRPVRVRWRHPHRGTTPSSNTARLRRAPAGWVGSGWPSSASRWAPALRSAEDLDRRAPSWTGATARRLRLVKPKLSVHPDAKLSAGAGGGRGGSPRPPKRANSWAPMPGRAVRPAGAGRCGVGDAHCARGRDGRSPSRRDRPEMLWPPTEEALANADRRVRVGNRGGDMGWTCPSPSAPSTGSATSPEPPGRGHLHGVRARDRGRRAVVAYGDERHHGNGQPPVLDTSGLMGTITRRTRAR